MNTKMHPRESGQILVIFVIVLAALLGFTALAIDGGMIFADRRYSQSVADTSSLAGAGAAAQYLEENGVSWESFSCTNPKVLASRTIGYNAALNRAVNNQVLDLDSNLDDKHGVEIICVNDPDRFEKYLDIHTMVTSNVSTSFAHLFYKGAIKNSVNSVTRIHPRTEFAFGQAIVSLGETCGTNDGGVVFDGTSDVYINGGGVFSNSCIEATGNVHVDVDDGGIDYFSQFIPNGHPILDPYPQVSGAKMPKQNIGIPNCGGSTEIDHSGDGTIAPGNYSKIKLTNGTLTLQPGLYCLTGDVDIQGGIILGDGVTFYMKKVGNSPTAMQINGSAESHLNAPTDSNVVGGAKVGILVYMAEGNAGNISLLGTAESSFTGAIYAYDGTIDIGGTTGVNPTYNTQLVGKYVKVHGTSQIDINFHTFPPSTEEPKLDQME
jgi:hypothetical protein